MLPKGSERAPADAVRAPVAGAGDTFPEERAEADGGAPSASQEGLTAWVENSVRALGQGWEAPGVRRPSF